MLPRGAGAGLCKPPMECNSPVASQAKGQPPHHLPFHLPLLGWSHVVAPINKNEAERHQVPGASPPGGDVHQLLARIHARTKMVPSLHSVIRQKLERP
jgi:hypothetical protein